MTTTREVDIVAKRLRYHLKNRNLTVYAYAKILGKPHQAVYKIVNGRNKKSISLKLLEEYAKALDLNVSDLVTPLPDEFLEDPPEK